MVRDRADLLVIDNILIITRWQHDFTSARYLIPGLTDNNFFSFLDNFFLKNRTLTGTFNRLSDSSLVTISDYRIIIPVNIGNVNSRANRFTLARGISELDDWQSFDSFIISWSNESFYDPVLLSVFFSSIRSFYMQYRHSLSSP